MSSLDSKLSGPQSQSGHGSKKKNFCLCHKSHPSPDALLTELHMHNFYDGTFTFSCSIESSTHSNSRLLANGFKIDSTPLSFYAVTLKQIKTNLGVT
jgi:hypothetical protein